MPRSIDPEVSSPPAPSVPGKLLAALLSAGSLVQPEPVLTRAVRFLLGLPGAHGALDDLIRQAGIQPPASGYWLTEVGHEAGGRTDLEYWGGNDQQPKVVVEAKIGHALEGSQLSGYRPRLGEDGGLLVALVPSTRIRTAQTVVDELNSSFSAVNDPVHVALWTWDQVAAALEVALPGNHDVVQLRGLIEVAGALDILPFTASQLDVADDSRFDDLWRVVSRASAGLFDQRLPTRHGGPFVRWRFVSIGDFGASFRVGIGRANRGEHEPWVWASVHEDARFGRVAQEALLARYPDALRDSQYVAVPIVLAVGLSGAELAEDIRAELNNIATVIRESIEASAAIAQKSNAGKSVEAPDALVGIPAFTREDLLDSSSRREDIVAVVRAVLAHLLTGGSIRFNENEPFAQRAWIGVYPFRTHLSLGIERTDVGTEPQPWAWLSVHDVTPFSAVVVGVLDELFPGEAVDIPKGHGVPVDIPPGSNGVEAFHSVLAQVEQAIAKVRDVLSGPGPF